MKPAPALWLSAASIIPACCRGPDLSKLPPLPPGRVMEIGGHKLFFRQTGSGPDVVLLHGLGDSSVGWQFVEPELVKAGYRVLVWDALGAGQSARPGGHHYGIEAHLERLEKLLDALGVRRAAFVGHSLGGSVALFFAQRHPGRVRALCLVDAAAYREGVMGGRWFWNAPLLADIVLGILPTRAIIRIALRQNFHDRAKIPASLEGMYLREATGGRIAALIAQQRQLVPKDPEKWERGHRTIRAPTLILWGREDRMVPVAQGERLAKEIAGARFVILPNVGHSSPLEAPQALLEHLLPFLKESGSE
ncbi:MAG: alpha/beta hydrolase [Planctomycetes bacterium]|nr:alpha/beta hydrolase [Planctomycetota bacterium]